MLLVLDIGNTNIAMGTYEGKELQKHWRISTDRQKTGDEYGMLINSLFHYQGIEMADIHAIIISSVVPPLVVPFIKMCERYFHLRPLIVGPGIKTGIRLQYENPRSIGADRIVNVVGAYEQYGGPLIVIDIGTATTFDVVAKNGDFLGGVIAPGIGTSSEIDEIARRIKREMRENGVEEEVKVIATGGLARMISKESATIDKIDHFLTLTGLRVLYERNQKGHPHEDR